MTNYHISISAYNVSNIGWSEARFLQALGQELTAMGHNVSFFFAGEKPDLVGGDEAVLRIVGPHLEEPVEGAINLLWIVSPPAIAPLGQLARFDHVFCCSAFLVAYYSKFSIRTSYLPKAVDTEHFKPLTDADRKKQLPVVFVGDNAPQGDLGVVFAAAKGNVGLKVWGGGWKGALPSDVFEGEHLDFDELVNVYASARIVLNPQTTNMKKLGMIASPALAALSCGAEVITEPVAGFPYDSSESLFEVGSPDGALELIASRLAMKPPTEDERSERHKLIQSRYGFARCAYTIDEIYQKKRANRDRAKELSRPNGSLPAEREMRHFELQDFRPQAFTPSKSWQSDIEQLKVACDDSRVSVSLTLTPPEAGFPAGQRVVLIETAFALLRLAKILSLKNRFEKISFSTQQMILDGEINALMPDLRTMQNLLTDPQQVNECEQSKEIAARAQLAVDLITDRKSPFAFRDHISDFSTMFQRAIRQIPLYAHNPANFDRDRLKHHVRLWPRKKTVSLRKPLGIFIHLYYAGQAPIFAKGCAKIDAEKRIYISTNTNKKREQILKSFPGADVRVMANVGRDICPKYFGFGDAWKEHSIVLHLHSKKSPHFDGLDAWSDHLLDNLLPSAREINRILSFFQSIPELGIVSPLPFQPILPAAHWGANYDIAREIAARMKLKKSLPGNDELQFPVGSMFWARSEITSAISCLDLKPGHFPIESGQTDGTVAHAIERLVGVVCQQQGYHQISVASSSSKDYRAFGLDFKTNDELRKLLSGGDRQSLSGEDQDG